VQTIVCIREALDWNLSTKQFRVDPRTFEPVVAHARYRIDQFDEIALETALQYREAAGGPVRALCLGTADSEDTLKHALAMQADTATLLETELAPLIAAPYLAAAISGMGSMADAGPVLCGRMSSDHGTGTTAPLLAELLGRPLISNVTHIEGTAHDWRCTRETPTGHEVLRVTRPFVASITNAPHNVPRVPGIRQVMQAHRKTIDVVPSAGLNAGFTPRLKLVRRHVPVNLKGCRFLQGTPQEQARELAAWLRAEVPQLQGRGA
jgi:electron transfer flavoprotein beta subunit